MAYTCKNEKKIDTNITNYNKPSKIGKKLLSGIPLKWEIFLKIVLILIILKRIYDYKFNLFDNFFNIDGFEIIFFIILVIVLILLPHLEKIYGNKNIKESNFNKKTGANAIVLIIYLLFST